MGSCTYLDPPRIPLNKGDFEENLVPPLLRGAPGGSDSMQPHKKLVLPSQQFFERTILTSQSIGLLNELTSI